MFSAKNKDGEENIAKKPRAPVNVKERALSDESGGLFSSSKTIDALGRQNVMWRATMNTLNFIPINTVDYDGGLIITDWYSTDKSNESIKINVSFNSNEVKVSSVEVKSFKKSCDSQLNCKTTKMADDFNKKIKDQIFEEIKNLEIKKKS